MYSKIPEMRRSESGSRPLLEIGGLRIDVVALVADVAGTTLPLGSKVVATLVALHDHAGDVVSKPALMASVWGDLPIDESSLWQNVHVLRGVLKRYAPDARIETVKGRGYRLIAGGSSAPAEPAASNLTAPCAWRARLPGWVWSLGGAAAASLVFGAMHPQRAEPRAHRVLFFVRSASDKLPPLPPLPGDDGEGTRILFAPMIRR